MHKVLDKFLVAVLWRDNTCLQKFKHKFKIVFNRKKAFNLYRTSIGKINVHEHKQMQVHVCVNLPVNFHGNVNVSSRSIIHPVFFLPCLPGTLLRAESCQLSALVPWLPMCSAASTSCLQEGQSTATFFHFLWCLWYFRAADHSRPVAMADCCPSPCWPHTIVQQSTGILKPLVECMMLRELPKAKGYIWLYILSRDLIRTVYN